MSRTRSSPRYSPTGSPRLRVDRGTPGEGRRDDTFMIIQEGTPGVGYNASYKERDRLMCLGPAEVKAIMALCQRKG